MRIKYAWWPTLVEPKGKGFTKSIWFKYYVEFDYELMEKVHVIRKEL